MIRDLIKQLRYTAEVLEQFVGPASQAQETVHMSGTPMKRSNDEILELFADGFNNAAMKKPVPYRWSTKPVNKKQEEGRMKRKYTKLHWTKRPENKAKLAKIIKKMQAAKKAK